MERRNKGIETANLVRRQSAGSLDRLNGGRASRLFCDCPETKGDISSFRAFIAGSISHTEVVTWQSSITFVQDLKQKLQHTMPDVGGAARDQLLLHQLKLIS